MSDEPHGSDEDPDADEGLGDGDPGEELRWTPQSDPRWGERPSPSGHELEPVPWPPDEDLAPHEQLPDHPAAVWRRVLARVLDVLFWTFVTGVVLTWLHGDVTGATGDDGPQLSDRALFVAWVLPMVIDVVLVGLVGWDPGKLVLRMRVCRADGSPPGVRAAAARTAIIEAPRLLSLLPVMAVLAGWLLLPWVVLIIWSMWNGPGRQGWQDRVAGTWVIDHEGRRSMQARLGGRSPDRGA